MKLLEHYTTRGSCLNLATGGPIYMGIFFAGALKSWVPVTIPIYMQLRGKAKAQN